MTSHQCTENRMKGVALMTSRVHQNAATVPLDACVILLFCLE